MPGKKLNKKFAKVICFDEFVFFIMFYFSNTSLLFFSFHHPRPFQELFLLTFPALKLSLFTFSNHKVKIAKLDESAQFHDVSVSRNCLSLK